MVATRSGWLRQKDNRKYSGSANWIREMLAQCGGHREYSGSANWVREMLAQYDGHKEWVGHDMGRMEGQQGVH